jgi:2-polyprenyl-3-methyl-5-hydroxy-6-metoxy-1,4-benzoquinol methylase
MWSVADWVSIQLRCEALERHVRRGSRVLEFKAGTGVFTEVLHRLGCTISVVDESAEELESHRSQSLSRGFGRSVEGWHQKDVASLDAFPDQAYDAVVAYGGSLGFALQQRDQALAQYRRVLRPGGLLALDVLSLWGTVHRQLKLVVLQDIVHGRSVIRSGDVAGETGKCHLFRAAELESFVRRGGFELLSLSASSFLSTGKEMLMPDDAGDLSALLEYERVACAQSGCLDGGSRLIAIARNCASR